MDELVIRVSQELRSKDYNLRDFNYQVANDRDHLHKQVEILKRELQEEKSKYRSLEVLETDLVHKL